MTVDDVNDDETVTHNFKFLQTAIILRLLKIINQIKTTIIRLGILCTESELPPASIDNAHLTNFKIYQKLRILTNFKNKCLIFVKIASDMYEFNTDLH